MKPATFASVHVADHRSLREAHAWRRQLSRESARVGGLRWLKAVTTLGNARRGGFSLGPPRPRRQFVIAAWESRDDFEAFYAGSAFARCERAWHVLLRPWRTNGSFHGVTPFGQLKEPEPQSGPIAVLTLGRSRWGRLPAFIKEGTSLTPSILNSPGLITALTAGFPVTGNATFSVWERTEDMRRFAYEAVGNGHRATIEADRRLRILREQITVRFMPEAVLGSWDLETTPNAQALGRLAERLRAS